MITLIFEIPTGKVYTIKYFAQYIRNLYSTQTAYRPDTNTLEIQVPAGYENNVVNVALSYDYILISGPKPNW